MTDLGLTHNISGLKFFGGFETTIFGQLTNCKQTFNKLGMNQGRYVFAQLVGGCVKMQINNLTTFNL